jgi:hypothetical protein
MVTLTANPTPPYTFGSWSGDGCTGGSPTCRIPMNQARTVTATFNPPDKQRLTVSMSPSNTGRGTVTSMPEGIDCGNTCAFDFDFNTGVTLTADPDSSSDFVGWSGACSGGGTCIVTMNQAQNVTALFTEETFQLTVTKAGQGDGTVTSNPAGINCAEGCPFASANFPQHSQVTLQASPAGSWSVQSCRGKVTTCTVTMDQAKTVTVTFDPPPTPTVAPTATPSPGSPPPGEILQKNVFDYLSPPLLLSLFREPPTVPRTRLMLSISPVNFAPGKREE